MSASRRSLALAVAGVISVAGSAGVVLLRPGHVVARAVTPPPGSTVLGVTDATLFAGGGVTFSAAVTLQPPITQTEAEATTLATSPSGTAVRSSALRHVRIPGMSPPVDADCWVVSLSPWEHGSGPAGHPGSAATFHVAFIDAQSGAILVSVAGS